MFKGAENLLSVNKDTVLCWQNIKSKCQASETAKYTSIYTTETDVVMSAQRHDAGFRGKFYISHGFMGKKKPHIHMKYSVSHTQTLTFLPLFLSDCVTCSCSAARGLE